MKTMLKMKKPDRTRRLQFEPLEERTLLAANPDVLFQFSGSTSFTSDYIHQSSFSFLGDSFEIGTEYDYAGPTSSISMTGSATKQAGQTGMSGDLYVFHTELNVSCEGAMGYDPYDLSKAGGQSGVSGGLGVYLQGNFTYHLEVEIKGEVEGTYENCWLVSATSSAETFKYRGYGEGGSIEHGFMEPANVRSDKFHETFQYSYIADGGISSSSLGNIVFFDESYDCLWCLEKLYTYVRGDSGLGGSFSSFASTEITIKLWVSETKPEIVGMVVSDNPTTGQDTTFYALVPLTYEYKSSVAYSTTYSSGKIGDIGNGEYTYHYYFSDIYAMSVDFSFGDYYGNQHVTVNNYTTWYAENIPGIEPGNYLVFSITITPDNGKHSRSELDKEVFATLKFQNLNTGEVGFSPIVSETFTLFFDKFGTDNQSNVTTGLNEPNWFVYWKEDQATTHGQVPNVRYDGDAPSGWAGWCQPGTGEIALTNLAATYQTDWFLPPGMVQPVEFLTGIDLVENVLRHELLHRFCTELHVYLIDGIEINLTLAQLYYGKEDSDGDDIPDNLEELLNELLWEQNFAGLGFNKNNAHSFSLWGEQECTYLNYDQEVLARLVSLHLVEIPEFELFISLYTDSIPDAAKDYANPGKNTTPSYCRIAIPETGTDASLTGVAQERISADKKSLQFDVEVDVRDAGFYTVFANLFDANRRVYSAENYLWLEPGVQNVTLDFDGTALRKSRFEGELTLENITLFGATFEDFDGTVYTTRTLSYTDFAPPVMEITSPVTPVKTGESVEYQVSITQSTATTANSYYLSAYLCTEDGTMVDYVKTPIPAQASAGTYDMTFSFDAGAVRRARAEGVLVLQYVKILDAAGNEIDGLLRSKSLITVRTTDFGVPDVALTGTLHRQVLDDEETGITVVFTAEVQTAVAGSYIAMAELLDQHGVSAGVTVVTVSLDYGAQEIQFSMAADGLAVPAESLRIGRVVLYGEDLQVIDVYRGFEAFSHTVELTMPESESGIVWAVRMHPFDLEILQIMEMYDSSDTSESFIVIHSFPISTFDRLVINGGAITGDVTTAVSRLDLELYFGAFPGLTNGIHFNANPETFNDLKIYGPNNNDSMVQFCENEIRFHDLAVSLSNVNSISICVDKQSFNQALVIGSEAGSTMNLSENRFVMSGGGIRLQLDNFDTIDAIASGRNDKTYVYGENNSLIVMNDTYVECRTRNQSYRVWYSKQVIAVNNDDTNNAILHTGSRGYDVYTLSQGYGTATNAAGSYFHEFIGFENVMTPSLPFVSSTVSQPTALEIAGQSAALKMAAPLANVLESENIMPSDAILEKPFAHDHENEKLYAFLADLHIREQRKKDKFYETDDWLAGFEKQALLELRK